jgi:trehalose 6-phosphate phosphatase
MSPDLHRALEELADGERLLVALDFDGTISPIVAVPSEARPAPGVLELLQSLSASPTTEVVLVSGRSRRDLAEVSGAEGVATLVGSHGQEIGADLTPDAHEAAALVEIRGRVSELVEAFPGIRVEDKPAGLAVHVRGCSEPDTQTALELVRRLTDSLPGTFSLEGKLVVELSLRPLDKGSALRALIAADPGRRVLFAGDDVTDESAMAVLRPTDLAIKVGPGPSLARYRVPDPPAMVEVLSLLAKLRPADAGGTARP